MPRPRITLELLHRLKSPKGGYTREALAILEIPWPPKKGWRRKLMIEAKENFARDEFEKEQAKRQVPASDGELKTKLDAALARINELETAFRTTRDRLSFHDGCSRFNVKDSVILRDADSALKPK